MSELTTQNPPKNLTIGKLIREFNGHVSKELIIAKALEGLNNVEIAKELDCTNSYVSRIIKPYRDAIVGYLIHKDNPSHLWEWKEFQVLSSVRDEDIKKASLRDKGIFAGTARDKINIERGKSALTPTNMTFIVVNHSDNQPDKCKDITPITVNSDEK